MSQADKILAYLQTGRHITPAMAYELFGTLALHSRVAELRCKGHDIRMRIVTHNGQRWGDYWLPAAVEARQVEALAAVPA